MNSMLSLVLYKKLHKCKNNNNATVVMVHAVSPYKKRLYKKRLVKFQQIKKRRLVNSSHAKKQISQNFCKKMAIF